MRSPLRIHASCVVCHLFYHAVYAARANDVGDARYDARTRSFLSQAEENEKKGATRVYALAARRRAFSWSVNETTAL